MKFMRYKILSSFIVPNTNVKITLKSVKMQTEVPCVSTPAESTPKCYPMKIWPAKLLPHGKGLDYLRPRCILYNLIHPK